MNNQINHLNQNQSAAANWKDGPFLVLAGPGSGKTMVLTLRSVNLIKNSQNERYKVLCLTFSTKASNEMKERIEKYLDGKDLSRIHCRTFHSFCADLLRQHGNILGLKPDFTIITDEKDKTAILKIVIDNLKGNYDYYYDCQELLNKIEILMQNPKIKENSNYKKLEIENTIHKLYISELIRNNQLDFDALIFLTIQLLSQNQRVKNQINTVYKYICVDEFQDTNEAQYNLIRLIANSTESNIFFVADEDQIIYQFNGADPDRLQNLYSDYHITEIQLPNNYRCPPEVVTLANKLISFNKNRNQNKMQSIAIKSSQPNSVNLNKYNSLESEIEGIASQLCNISKEEWQKCIILARNNQLLKETERILKKHNINAKYIIKRQEFNSIPLKIIFYSLKLYSSPQLESLVRILCATINEFNNSSLSAEKIINYAKLNQMSYYRAFLETIAQGNNFKILADALLQLLNNPHTFETITMRIFEFFDSISNNDINFFPDYEHEKILWNKIVSRMKSDYGDNIPIFSLIQEIDLTPKTQDNYKNCVNLQTVHSSKGLEYNHVFIIGLTEGIFPSFYAIKSGDDSRLMEEERRNFFVAITRAEKTLRISYSENYFGYYREPSRFLLEMGLLN